MKKFLFARVIKGNEDAGWIRDLMGFFVPGVNQGELEGGVHPRFSCVTQKIKLTLKTCTSRVVQFIVCGGFVDD